MFEKKKKRNVVDDGEEITRRKRSQPVKPAAPSRSSEQLVGERGEPESRLVDSTATSLTPSTSESAEKGHASDNGEVKRGKTSSDGIGDDESVTADDSVTIPGEGNPVQTILSSEEPRSPGQTIERDLSIDKEVRERKESEEAEDTLILQITADEDSNEHESPEPIQESSSKIDLVETSKEFPEISHKENEELIENATPEESVGSVEQQSTSRVLEMDISQPDSSNLLTMDVPQSTEDSEDLDSSNPLTMDVPKANEELETEELGETEEFLMKLDVPKPTEELLDSSNPLMIAEDSLGDQESLGLPETPPLVESHLVREKVLHVPKVGKAEKKKRIVPVRNARTVVSNAKTPEVFALGAVELKKRGSAKRDVLQSSAERPAKRQTVSRSTAAEDMVKTSIDDLLDNRKKKAPDVLAVDLGRRLIAESVTASDLACMLVGYVTKHVSSDQKNQFRRQVVDRVSVVSVPEEKIFTLVGNLLPLKEEWGELWKEMLLPLEKKLMSTSGKDRSRYCTWIRIYCKTCLCVNDEHSFRRLMKFIILRCETPTAFEGLMFMAGMWPEIFTAEYRSNGFDHFRKLFSVISARLKARDTACQWFKKIFTDLQPEVDLISFSPEGSMKALQFLVTNATVYKLEVCFCSV